MVTELRKQSAAPVPVAAALAMEMLRIAKFLALASEDNFQIFRFSALSLPLSAWDLRKNAKSGEFHWLAMGGLYLVPFLSYLFDTRPFV